MSKTHNETAIFGGGCFWGIQALFDEVPGVIETVVGYSGGHTVNPTYKEVCTDTTYHAEVIQIVFDHEKISYMDLLKLFFDHHDPTTKNRQGVDVGTQYRSVIFYTNEEQKKQALQFITMLTTSHRFKNPIVTEVHSAETFYLAEDYHQKYLRKQGKAHCDI